MSKTALREKMRGRLKMLPAFVRAESSTALVRAMLQHPFWKRAQSILLFSPLNDEPDIRPLLREAFCSGKHTALPSFNAVTRDYSARFVRDAEADLVAGEFGITEPGPACEEAALNRLDLVLVPGVAFDARGGRLGRGKGFYDRLLLHVRGTTCGVAFDEQIIEAVPHEPHDVRLNCILTPTRLIET